MNTCSINNDKYLSGINSEMLSVMMAESQTKSPIILIHLSKRIIDEFNDYLWASHVCQKAEDISTNWQERLKLAEFYYYYFKDELKCVNLIRKEFAIIYDEELGEMCDRIFDVFDMDIISQIMNVIKIDDNEFDIFEN